MPVYNDTPLATESINQTQDPIRTNFQSIKTLIDVNHVDFSDPVDFGKHKWVTFPQQVQATAQAANIYPDLGIYSAPNVATGVNELYFRNSGNVVTDVPFTAALYALSGWTFLPSGLLLQWGRQGVLDNGDTGNINFPIPFPNAVFTMSASILNGNAGITPPRIYIRTLTAAQFSIISQGGASGNTSAAGFFAIGY